MQEISEQQRLLELLRAGQPEDVLNIDTSTVRYALYARKSTTSEDRQASSIEDQIKDCMERVVTPDNLNIVKVYQESFSAKIADAREKFREMILDIENGRIDGVIAWHPDRLSRNMKEAGAIIDLVDRGSIRDLKFATFTFENTPAGKMLLGITFVMAKQYSEHLSESVSRGNRLAVEDGEFIGKFKHGYVLDTNRHFQTDSSNFVKIKHMFDMALDKKSQKEIGEWINKQDYKVQKRQGADPVSHKWSKDDVSELLRDPFYAGVLKYGKNLVSLVDAYDFTPAVSVDDFLTINKIDTFDSSKITSQSRPKTGERKADMLRGRVYCGLCQRPLTSMLLPKREGGELVHYRYYYKCETFDCSMKNKSAKASLVVDAAQKFFNDYLFVTKSNYDEYLKRSRVALKRRTAEFDSAIAKLKVEVSNKEKAYEQTKALLLNNPELASHYNLDKTAQEIDGMKANYKKLLHQRENVKESVPTFEEYLKLFESIPVILGKIRDMKVMDALLRIFFSNFIITPTNKDFRQGSEVSYKLNEPWEGFIENDNFVCGAG